MCGHKNTHFEDWPDGGWIEVCDDCGMSRYCWENGHSDWQTVDIEKSRKSLQGALDKIRRGHEDWKKV